MTKISLRTFTNKVGTSYTPGATTKPYAEDLNQLKDALQSGVREVLLKVWNVTTLERDALSGTAGMIVWNTDETELQVYDGNAWGSLAGGGGGIDSRTRKNGSDFTGSTGGTGRTYVHTSGISLKNLVMVSGKTLDPNTEYSLTTTSVVNDTLVITGPLFDEEVVVLWQ
jgi:hypothetical protein